MQAASSRRDPARRDPPRPAKQYTPRCRLVSVGRTNIEIDDALVERAMRRYRLRSKREAVDLALRRLVGEPLSLDEARAMEGSGWDADLEQIRRGGSVPEL